MGLPELVIIMVFSIPIAAIIGSFFIAALKILVGDKKSKKSEETNAEETKIIQEIHQGLARMENRVEHLETILIDRARREQNYDA